jgi:hypothetical protein
MKLAFILTVSLLGLPQSVADRPFELKGDVPGMTLKQFKQNHKQGMWCSKDSATLTSRRVYQDVSLAGVEAHTFKGCALSECMFQGIFAKFVDGQLVQLRYGVAAGSANEIIAALKKKYGDPTKSDENPNFPGRLRGATWKNTVGYLTVSDAWAAKQPLESSTAITSGLNDAGESKDL